MDDAPRPLRALIVDDSLVARRVLSALIRAVRPDVAIEEATSGRGLGAVLRRSPADIVFVDIHMPGLTGIEAVALARTDGLDPLVVLMVEEIEEVWEAEAREIQAYEILQKPLDESELRLLLANVGRMRQPRRALVVDDSRAARLLVGRVLETSRFALSVDAVEGGELALAALEARPYDVLFLDYDMPVIDGLETACLVGEVAPALPIVMISASVNPAVERAARYFGARHFLQKPFYGRDVDLAMHAILRLPCPSLLGDPAAGRGLEGRAMARRR